MLVIGMGKLGGRELNVSSDVDYIFIYPEDSDTAGTPNGGRKIEAYDFFTRLGKRLIAAQLGIAPETFSRVLRSLREHGLIAGTGNVLRLPQPGVLQNMVGG